MLLVVGSKDEVVPSSKLMGPTLLLVVVLKDEVVVVDDEVLGDDLGGCRCRWYPMVTRMLLGR